MILLETPSEEGALAGLAALESVLGALPQAELLQPWDDDEPHVLRVDMPGLTPQQASAVRELPADFQVVAGLPPGARTARDHDAVLADTIQAGHHTATLWSDAVEGGLCLPDLDTEDPDPAGAAVASELAAALRGVSAELLVDAASSVSFVRHRPTGRRGIRLQVPQAPLLALSGDALLTLRQDVIAAVGAVVDRRPADLSCDLGWDPRQGLAVLVWRHAPAGAALPGDSVVEAGTWPSADALRAVDLADRVHALELQIVPSGPHTHDAVIDEVIEVLGEAPVDGAEPRWVYARGLGPSFCPCWRISVEHVSELADLLPALSALADVVALRVVPVEPVGLEELSPFLDPSWRWTGARWVVRWRDGVRDRDRLVAWVPRDLEPADHSLTATLLGLLGRVPGEVVVPDADGRVVRPIIDELGRHGLALHGPPELADDPARLGWLLGLLGSVPLPGLSDVVDLALPVDGVVLHLWHRRTADLEGDSPAWVSVG